MLIDGYLHWLNGEWGVGIFYRPLIYEKI